MNKDFAAWWLAELDKDKVPKPNEYSHYVLPAKTKTIRSIAESAWEAAVKCEEEKRRQNGGPG